MTTLSKNSQDLMPGLPLDCIRSTDELIVVFVNQHLEVGIEIFYLGRHSHMPLEQPL